MGIIQNDSTKFNQFQNFMVSIGIDDRKHVFMFVLGFVSALAISRIRVSSILVFPASVLVFSLGFTLGFVKKIGFVDHGVRNEKMKKLRDVIGGVGAKVMELEKELSDMEGGCCDVVKAISFDIAQAKSIVEDTGELVEEKNVSKRKKDPGPSYFDFFQVVGGLFHENAAVGKSSKMKEKLDSTMSERTDEVQAIRLESDSEIEASKNQAWSQNVAGNSVNGAGKVKVVSELVNGNTTTVVGDVQRSSNSDEFRHFDYSSRFGSNNGNFMKIGYPNGEDMFVPGDNLYDPLDLNINTRSSGVDVKSFTMDSEASLQPEDYHVASNKYQGKFHRKRNGANGGSELEFDEMNEDSDDTPNRQQFTHDLEEDSGSASSVISEDLMFSKHLTEATDLLKNARECLKARADEDRAEIMLYKSARLLSSAAAMKPMSLLAVGQLGNTFLLHGELKLRISRELRTVLSRNDYSSRGKFRIAVKGLDERNISRDRVASVLIDVCEECEGLLVEAGRQYKMALTIDGNDVRALYNWGLALSYRAQLIADIGPKAASDADRVYLAAIDKFNAMMSRNKVYAPDALFRWGIALQQRSRLRPNNAKEKKKLLHQAKSLFEDALYMDSNKVQVREALSSCISELNYSHF